MTAMVLLTSYLRPYLPVGLCALVVILTGALLLGLSQVLGPSRHAPGKETPYECGVPLLGSARERFSIRFYLVAILFVLFDIETVFLIPWAVTYRDLVPEVGAYIVLEMFVFIGILALGFVYAWKRGGLDWD